MSKATQISREAGNEAVIGSYITLYGIILLGIPFATLMRQDIQVPHLR